MFCHVKYSFRLSFSCLGPFKCYVVIFSENLTARDDNNVGPYNSANLYTLSHPQGESLC